MKILLLASRRKYGGSGRGYYVGWFEELFREELIRTSWIDVCPFGWGYCDEEIKSGKSFLDKVRELGGVDVALTSFSLGRYKGFNDIDALKVNVTKDFYNEKYKIKRYYKHYKKMRYDIIFAYGSVILDKLKRENIGGYRYIMPFGVDVGIHRKFGIGKRFDVITPFTIYAHDNSYSFRVEIRNMIKKMDVSKNVSQAYFYDMVRLINEARVCINHSPVPIVNPRVTEVLSCGTFLLTNYCNDYTEFGYKDGKHLVFYDGLDDLADKVNYYLKNDSRREKIAESGRRFVRKYYNNGRRVKYMVKVIKEHL